MYTTGEIAKLCGVSVRTVQYYDSRKILVPSEISEGGRRLYSLEDVNRLKTICFLRNVGISIDGISDLIKNDDKDQVINLLLNNQEKELILQKEEIEKKLYLIANLKEGVKGINNLSLESIETLSYVIDNKKNLKKLHIMLIVLGLPFSIMEIVTVLIWIFLGNFIPFICFLGFDIIFGIFISIYYFNRTVYVCPNCHNIFKPKFKEAFFAKHTPKLRKLTCTCCGYKGYCVETYRKKEKKHA